jgi:hypothetical protein
MQEPTIFLLWHGTLAADGILEDESLLGAFSDEVSSNAAGNRLRRQGAIPRFRSRGSNPRQDRMD